MERGRSARKHFLIAIVCCIGIELMSRLSVFAFHSRYAMAFLFFAFIPFINAVCVHCFDNIAGCAGGEHCPLLTGTASNAAIIAGGTGLVTLTHLLPLKFLRAFPRAVLDALSAIASAPKAGQPYNFDGKSVQEIFKAVVAHHCTADEALIELQSRVLNIAESSESATLMVTKLSRTIDVIKTLQEKGPAGPNNPEGTENCAHTGVTFG